MTVPRYMAIQRYQKDTPPLHIMVAGYLGIGSGGGGSKSEVDENGDSLFDLFPMGRG